MVCMFIDDILWLLQEGIVLKSCNDILNYTDGLFYINCIAVDEKEFKKYVETNKDSIIDYINYTIFILNVVEYNQQE